MEERKGNFAGADARFMFSGHRSDEEGSSLITMMYLQENDMEPNDTSKQIDVCCTLVGR